MRRPSTLPAICFLFVALTGASSFAQFGVGSNNKGISLGKPVTQRWKVGVVVTAAGPCSGVFATVPVPTDWPEQQVRVADEEVSPQVRIRYRVLDNGVKQMLVDVPFLAARQSASALVTYDVTRAPIVAPVDTSIFKTPRKAPRDARKFLAQSPYIEVRNSKIRGVGRKLAADGKQGWELAESIYDWVRANVKFKEGKLKGAAAALRDGDGDCEELTSLFIALCRANKIPARTVWVPGHCYPEFYLVDDQKKGHWFPCQAAGTRAFGAMPDPRPILQKGDNFRVPELKRETQRYVAEYLSVKAVGGAQPKVRFIRQLLPPG